jgi:23S rRNA (uridine2552-2'-O)-methyltransferase
MEEKKLSRNKTVRLKTAKGRKISSTNWLQRQLNDPYVTNARNAGYRSRAAYKLLEINDKFKFLHKGQTIIDLGAAPGGWSQVAIDKIGFGEKNNGKIIAIDLVAIEPITGVTFIQKDFFDDDAAELIISNAGGKADVVLSDMASPSCGHPSTDHIRIMALCEAALEFAKEILAIDGVFVAKILKGGTENQLLQDMKKHFKTVKHFKPPASRADSAESYVVAMGFRNEA